MLPVEGEAPTNVPVYLSLDSYTSIMLKFTLYNTSCFFPNVQICHILIQARDTFTLINIWER